MPPARGSSVPVIREGAFDPGPPPTDPAPAEAEKPREVSREVESFREKALRRAREAEAHIYEPGP